MVWEDDKKSRGRKLTSGEFLEIQIVLLNEIIRLRREDEIVLITIGIAYQ